MKARSCPLARREEVRLGWKTPEGRIALPPALRGLTFKGILSILHSLCVIGDIASDVPPRLAERDNAAECSKRAARLQRAAVFGMFGERIAPEELPPIGVRVAVRESEGSADDAPEPWASQLTLPN